MGKVIKIQGVDFSDIALASRDTDITSLFDFSEHTSKVIYAIASGTSYPIGSERTSAYFDASDYVDISAYRGKTIEIMFCKYASSNGGAPGYGLAWYDAEKVALQGVSFPKYTGDIETRPYGEPYVRSLIVPENATYLRTSYFGGTSGQALKTENFSCVVKG